MRAAMFFDRDGTMTRDHGYTHRVEDLEILKGVGEAVRACNDEGVLVVVVTNQAGLAKGKYGLEDMKAFHAAIASALERSHGAHVDAWYWCPYHGEGTVAALTIDNHPDRKPNAGMLRRALLEWNIDKRRAFLVGDRALDVEAAQNAGFGGAVVVAEGELLAAVKGALQSFASSTTTTTTTATGVSALKERAARAKAWLFDHALPLWWEQGFDRSTQCFFEKLDAQTGAAVPALRRTRVQARQTYVYAQAGALGWPGPWREAVSAGCKVLIERCIRPDGGTCYGLDATTATPTDLRRDLYDAAFVIFALSHGSKALQDASIASHAERLFEWVSSNWPHAAGGFLEGDVTPSPPHRQNPHMHMLEALLALYEATGKEVYLRQHALNIVRLFETRFVDQERGALLEYFDDQWKPMAGDQGRITEPGHQFEWCWLIDRVFHLSKHDARRIGRQIQLHGEVYGVNSSSSVVADEVWVEGTVKVGSSRLWPHTERIKAHVSRFETTGELSAALGAADAFDKLMTYCDVPKTGAWRDRISVDGNFVSEPAPASSFYHIMVAMSELIRVAEKHHE